MQDIQIRLIDRYELRPKLEFRSEDREELLSKIIELIEILEEDEGNLVGFYVSNGSM